MFTRAVMTFCIVLMPFIAVLAQEQNKPHEEKAIQSVALSNLDRTVIGIVFTLISTGVTTAALWAKPYLIKYVVAQIELAQSHSQALLALNKYAENYVGLESCFQVMCRVIVSMQASIARNKRLLLLIEDNPVSVKVIRSICADMMRRHHMEFINVMTLEDGYQHIQDAKIIVLDVTLPDTNFEKLNALINLVACPVIIFSDQVLEDQQFPGATFILSKKSSSEEIRRVLEATIMGNSITI